MNSALDNLYEELLRKVDDDEEPEEELTDAEKAKRFLEEKRVAIDKLKEISLKRLEEESHRNEEARMRQLERKRQAAVEKRLQQEKKEKEIIRDIEDKTMRFWKRDVTGKRKETGVVYVGQQKRHGDAWVPHGYGEYRVRGETVYDGVFNNGAMHGQGCLLLDTGETWVGQFCKDMVHGMGTIVAEDDSTKRRAIYWRDRRICFLDELKPGCRLQLLGSEFVRDAGGEAAVVAASGRPGRYLLRLDNGLEKLLRLDCEHFRLLRHKPHVVTLDTIVGSTRYKNLYDYDDDQAHPQKSAYRENFYWPDLWAAREREKKEKQDALDLETKRSQILARRQVERDAKAAADQAADVAKGLDEERQRKEEIERSAVEAAEKDKEALEMARVAAQAKKERQRELSRSPPRGP